MLAQSYTAILKVSEAPDWPDYTVAPTKSMTDFKMLVHQKVHRLAKTA